MKSKYQELDYWCLLSSY